MNGSEILLLTDEQFITEAERQGTVYNLECFQECFNCGNCSSNTAYMRVIERSNTKNLVPIL